MPRATWLPADEAWDVDYFLHENPEPKRSAYACLTDSAGWLPLPDREAVRADQGYRPGEKVCVVTAGAGRGSAGRAHLRRRGAGPAAGRQLTQGMPFSAPTAPPCGPAVGMTGDDEGLGVVVAAAAALMVGAVVVSAPISTST